MFLKRHLHAAACLISVCAFISNVGGRETGGRKFLGPMWSWRWCGRRVFDASRQENCIVFVIFLLRSTVFTTILDDKSKRL